MNLLDKARVSQTDFAKIKDFFKEQDISLVKGPIAELYKMKNEKWASLLGEDFSSYLSSELSVPFKDMRKTYKVFSFSKAISSIEDVKEDNLYWGVVTKFSGFGAFLDIGVGTEGLIHLSELANEFLSDARKVLRLGQWVLVKAIKVEPKKLSFSKIKAEKSFSSRDAGDRKFKSRDAGPGRGDKKSYSKKPFNKGGKSGGRPSAGGGRLQQRKPKTPFNNPFAALGDLNKK